MWLTVTGLLFDIAGAWLLAYEIIWGYQKHVSARYAEMRLKFKKEDHAKLRANIDKLSPPYNATELERLKSDLDKVYQPMIAADQAIVDEATQGHRDKSIIAACIGIGLLTLGFVLQIVAAVSAAQATAVPAAQPATAVIFTSPAGAPQPR